MISQIPGHLLVGPAPPARRRGEPPGPCSDDACWHAAAATALTSDLLSGEDGPHADYADLWLSIQRPTVFDD